MIGFDEFIWVGENVKLNVEDEGVALADMVTLLVKVWPLLMLTPNLLRQALLSISKF